MCFKKILLLLLVLFNCFQLTYSQEKLKDSIAHLEPAAIISGYYENIDLDNIEIAKLYAESYLKKIKSTKDPIKIALGYDFIAYLHNDSVKIKYLDSIIQLTAGLEHKIYPAQSYNDKGVFYHDKGDLKNALIYFLKADSLATENIDDHLIYISKHNIGLIKDDLGNHEEAISHFKEVYEYYRKNNLPEYLISLLSLSNSFIYNKQLDSATVYNTLGITKSLEIESQEYHHFVLNEGINLFYKKSYQNTIDSIKKALPFIKKDSKKRFLAYSYIYLGKASKELKNDLLSINYFKKSDSLFQETGIIIPESRDGYEALIDYYKSIKNKELQLRYIKKLLHLDSIINNNYKYLNNRIIREYDTPKLLFEKEQLITTLKSDNNRFSKNINILIFVLLILFGLLIYYYYKQQTYKKRFNKLISTNSAPQKRNVNSLKTNKKSTENIGISEAAVKEILEKLEKFETSKEYLNNSISLHSLAKKIKTNPNYLSRVINFYEKKTFRTYLNDIRVAYAVKELKNNEKFRRYTIKAIATEVGFNNAESFSTAFYKNAGIYPSYFIKRIEAS